VANYYNAQVCLLEVGSESQLVGRKEEERVG